ncbi:MAG: fluoride efflux transporter CrcB [Nocardioides sp.]
MTELVWVALGAAVGAPLRYLIGHHADARFGTALPWGTLIVNVVGSLALGLLAGFGCGRDLPQPIELTLGPGLCGALTTYSAFGHQTYLLHRRGATGRAVVNTVLNVTAGLVAASIGYVAATTC